MFKKLLLTFFLFIGSYIIIYPSKKENTELFDYCYSLEKIFIKNSVEKNKNLSKNFKTLLDDISKFGANKTKGAFANNIINQYKNSKNLPIITFVPNQIYCLTGYWIEKNKPGMFISIFYEKSKQRIDNYKDIKKEVDEFIKDINSEFKSINKEIKDFL